MQSVIIKLVRLTSHKNRRLRHVGDSLCFGQGYRNGYPFSEGENIVLGETDPFLEDWNCAWSNRYPFAEAPNRPRGNGYE